MKKGGGVEYGTCCVVTLEKGSSTYPAHKPLRQHLSFLPRFLPVRCGAEGGRRGRGRGRKPRQKSKKKIKSYKREVISSCT
jgi:hypothetical protein